MTETGGNKLAHDSGFGACSRHIHWEKLQATHGAQRRFIGKKVFCGRLSAAIVAAGKPLPQKTNQLN
jgi:hypothetical protein